MKGKLYGIGAGPGDSELLTIKAINAIKKCDVIAAPNTGNGEKIAFSIIDKYLNGKELIECHFAMDKDMSTRKKSRQAAADQITEFLDKGKDVGFITLGDPTIYSTYMYVHEIISARGFDTEIIPGITSFSAAAAALGVALCEGDEMLTVIPASICVGELLNYPGNKVIMKSGNNLTDVLDRLKEHGYGNRTKIAFRAAMNGQRLYTSIEEYEKSPESGYFTVVIVSNLHHERAKKKQQNKVV